MKNIVFLLLVGLLMTPPLLAQNTVIALRQDVKTEFLNFKKKQTAQWDKDYKGQNMVVKPKEYLEKMTQLVDKQALTPQELDTLIRLANAVQDGADKGFYAFLEGKKPVALDLIINLPNPTVPLPPKPVADLIPPAKAMETSVNNDKKPWSKWLIIAVLLLVGLIVLSKNIANGLFGKVTPQEPENPNYHPESHEGLAHYLPSFFSFFRKKKKETPSVSALNLTDIRNGNANNVGELPNNTQITATNALEIEKNRTTGVGELEEDKQKIALAETDKLEAEKQKIEAEKQKVEAEKQAFEKQKQALKEEKEAFEKRKQAEKQLEKRKAAEIQAALLNKYQKGTESKVPTLATQPMQTIENQDYSGRSFFLAGPNADGSFVNYNGSENFIPYTSMYRFTLDAQDETKVQFEFWNDPTSIHDALADQIGYLDPVSVGMNPHDTAAKKIKTEKKGHAKLVGERWILEKKAEIIYE